MRGLVQPSRHLDLVGAEGVRRAMEDLAALTGRRSIPVFAVVLQRHGSPWESIVLTAEELGFHVIDVGPRHNQYLADQGIERSSQGWIETFWRSPRDPHPNAVSHRLHADEILEVLREAGIGP